MSFIDVSGLTIKDYILILEKEIKNHLFHYLYP